MTAANGARGETWPDDLFRALLALEIRQVAYVPDAGHARLIEACDADGSMTAIPLASEEEGVALLAGAWLGGQRGVLLMQSSGIGNCVNMLSLARVCRFPLLVLMTMRGEAGEKNPWQVPMGRIAAELLRLTGVAVHRAETPDEVAGAVAAAGGVAFGGPGAAAVLIAQSLIGVKRFDGADGADGG